MKRINYNERGNAILISLATLATLAICVAIAAEATSGTARNAQRDRAWLDGQSIGVGALDLAFASWRQICRANYTQALPTSSFASIATPTKANFPAITISSIDNYKVEALDPQLNVATGAPASTSGPTASLGSTFYKGSVDVTIPVIPGSVTVKVRRIFEKRNTSPWQWAIFYNDPLEIHPGPPFTVTGWVHTNSMLYTGHSSLTFASKVTYSGGWKIGFMPGDGSHTETPTSPYWPKDLPPAPEQSHQPNGLDPTQVFDPNSTNPNITDGWRELIQRPVGGQPDPLASSRYYNQAGIKVVFTDNSGNHTITTTGMVDAGDARDTVDNALSWGQTIQDNREGGQNVRLVTLDVSRLYNGGSYTTSGSNLQGFNGIIYIADATASSTARRGIRLKNGQRLANGGLTVVSENPIYVQGDYNTGIGTPPSNTGDPTQPTVAGYNRQPAAIIGDAVYILSNAWVDSNSTKSITSPPTAPTNRIASNTTVNAAILAGIVPTGTIGSNYSGGVENFPRFMEDWRNNTFTYYGSMVELFPSKQAVGAWGAANVYNPPTRKWYFDTNFMATPPPGSLITTDYIKQKWYLE
jgi:hypothetical protein